MKLMPSSSTVLRIVSACPSVTGRPSQIRDPRISIAPKLNRVTCKPVRPKTEVGSASDTIDILSLFQVSLIDIICYIYRHAMQSHEYFQLRRLSDDLVYHFDRQLRPDERIGYKRRDQNLW